MFAIVFVLLRLMGKRELAEMTPFEFAMLVAIGDLLQQGVTHNDFSITGATLAITTFAFWTLVLTMLTYKSKRAVKWLDGEPMVIVHNGRFLRPALRRNRLTIAEVESEMRLAGIARVEEVAWAVLETNGKISFIERKGEDETAAGSPSDAKPA
jgi:uncharacterized membrane protein YcaP (DUF421 family)